MHVLAVPTIAVAFSFPLFLARRERHLARLGVDQQKRNPNVRTS
jgi:hypothetical protein